MHLVFVNRYQSCVNEFDFGEKVTQTCTIASNSIKSGCMTRITIRYPLMRLRTVFPAADSEIGKERNGPAVSKYGPQNMIDYTNKNITTRTAPGDKVIGPPYVELTLDNETLISKIEIMNISTSGKMSLELKPSWNLKGLNLCVYDTAESVVRQFTIDSVSALYVFP